MEHVIVIKIGGVSSQHLSQEFIQQIKQWKAENKQVVIVHGGGFAINQLMEEEHVPITKKNGLRVTRQSDMKLVSYALLKIVGANLVKKLNQSSLDSVQLLSNMPKVVQQISWTRRLMVMWAMCRTSRQRFWSKCWQIRCCQF